MTSLDLPPEPTANYHLWRKDIAIWRKLTDIPKVKMGFALQYVCKTNERLHEAVLNIPEKEVDGENGIDNVLKELDKWHQIDKREAAFTLYKDFMAFRRKENQTVAEFILQFDAMLEKVESLGNHFSENYLAYKLLRSANLNVIEERIVKASTYEFNANSVKTTLRRMFGESTCINEVKENPNTKTVSKEQENRTFHMRKQKNMQKSNFRFKNKPKILNNGKNPLDKFGKMTHCHLCFSVNHWKSLCPDRYNNNVIHSDKTSSHIVLFEDQMKRTRDKERSYDGVEKFNDIVGVNIMNINGQLIIILIDGHTNYLESGLLTSKDPKCVIDFILKNWIGIFGSPSKFVIPDFDKFEIMDVIKMANAFNINIVAREYPWLVRLINKYSNVVQNQICRNIQDVNCPWVAAVAWSVSAQNNLPNSSNVSPSQLVFGYNILLPSVLGSKPPALTLLNYNKVLHDHFEAKRKAKIYTSMFPQLEIRKI